MQRRPSQANLHNAYSGFSSAQTFGAGRPSSNSYPRQAFENIPGSNNPSSHHSSNGTTHFPRSIDPQTSEAGVNFGDMQIMNNIHALSSRLSPEARQQLAHSLGNGFTTSQIMFSEDELFPALFPSNDVFGDINTPHTGLYGELTAGSLADMAIGDTDAPKSIREPLDGNVFHNISTPSDYSYDVAADSRLSMQSSSTRANQNGGFVHPTNTQVPSGLAPVPPRTRYINEMNQSDMHWGMNENQTTSYSQISRSSTMSTSSSVSSRPSSFATSSNRNSAMTNRTSVGSLPDPPPRQSCMAPLHPTLSLSDKPTAPSMPNAQSMRQKPLKQRFECSFAPDCPVRFSRQAERNRHEKNSCKMNKTNIVLYACNICVTNTCTDECKFPCDNDNHDPFRSARSDKRKDHLRNCHKFKDVPHDWQNNFRKIEPARVLVFRQRQSGEPSGTFKPCEMMIEEKKEDKDIVAVTLEEPPLQETPEVVKLKNKNNSGLGIWNKRPWRRSLHDDPVDETGGANVEKHGHAGRKDGEKRLKAGDRDAWEDELFGI